MAWTTPETFTAGQTLTAASMNAISGNLTALDDDVFAAIGTGFTTYAPTITQSGTVTHTATYAKYAQIGKLVWAQFALTVTGSGSAGNAVYVTLPVESSGSGWSIGGGLIFDASTATQYNGSWYKPSATTIVLGGDWAGSNAWGGNPSIGLATNDILRGYLMYEAA